MKFKIIISLKQKWSKDVPSKIAKTKFYQSASTAINVNNFIAEIIVFLKITNAIIYKKLKMMHIIIYLQHSYRKNAFLQKSKTARNKTNLIL